MGLDCLFYCSNDRSNHSLVDGKQGGLQRGTTFLAKNFSSRNSLTCNTYLAENQKQTNIELILFLALVTDFSRMTNFGGNYGFTTVLRRC